MKAAQDAGTSNTPDKDKPPFPQKKPRKRANYLCHEDRCMIIERIAGGEQQATLAREFGVTRAAVCHIQKHRFEILARPIACRVGEEDPDWAELPGVEQMVHELRGMPTLLLLSTLRDRETEPADFRRAAGRLMTMLIEEALAILGSRPTKIMTATGQLCAGLERQQRFCGVMLGEAAFPFSVLFEQIEMNAPQGTIYLEHERGSNGELALSVEFMDLPIDVAGCQILLFVATSSTGESECKAIETLCCVGVPERNISLVGILCAPDALVAISNRFPRVKIVSASIGDNVDPHTGMLVPGLGDFVSRYNGYQVVSLTQAWGAR